MKLFLFVVVIYAVILGQNACEDSLYNYLKSIDLDSMSQRQYDYFILKEKICLDRKVVNNTINKSSDVCTLFITINGYSDHSDYVYIDGIPFRYGKIPIKKGKHSINIFSPDNFKNAYDNKQTASLPASNYSGQIITKGNPYFYDRIIRVMRSCEIERDFQFCTSIHYQLRCIDWDRKNECDSDEWYYDWLIFDTYYSDPIQQTLAYFEYDYNKSTNNVSKAGALGWAYLKINKDTIKFNKYTSIAFNLINNGRRIKPKFNWIVANMGTVYLLKNDIHHALILYKRALKIGRNTKLKKALKEDMELIDKLFPEFTPRTKKVADDLQL